MKGNKKSVSKKRAGMLGKTGILCPPIIYKEWLVIKELYEQVKFDWVMFANKFTIYHHPKQMIDFMTELEKEGVGIINSAVFNGGFLTGGDYFDYRLVSPDNPEDRHLFAWREKFLPCATGFIFHQAMPV